MLKNRILKIGTVIIISAFICLTLSFSILSYSQGNDPIVTLSYLTEIILPQMKKDVVAEVSVMLDSFKEDESSETGNDISNDITDTPDATDTPLPPSETNSSGTYTLVELEKGQRIYTNSVLEFIVRPGSDVRVVSSFESQGVADITNATEYLNGDKIAINSYCIIPRGSDGRCIEVFNEKSYILVRGEYYFG